MSPLSIAPARCIYCIEDEKARLAAALSILEDEVLISDVLANTADKITARVCIKCTNRFCVDHASPVDQSDCCLVCLPFEAITEMKTPLVEVTDEGNHVLRKGYRLVPTGTGYKTLPEAVVKLSDIELEQFIQDKQTQIQLIEKQRDYLRVAQSTAKLEKNEREAAVQRQLRGIKMPIPANTPTGIKITGKKEGDVKGVRAPGKGLDVAEFLKFVAAKDAAKKTSPPSPDPAVVRAVGTKVSTAPGATPEVPVVKPPAPAVQKEAAPSTAELAREAEIEKILEGGEPER